MVSENDFPQRAGDVPSPEDCAHDCASCGIDCPSRSEVQGAEAPDFTAQANPGSAVRRMIGVVSGKGGVGKSLVTSLLAVAASREGARVGVLDADVTGPSIPRIFGVRDEILVGEEGLLPARTRGGIALMSVNLLLPEEETPVIWRGPVIAGTVKQFWTDVAWGELDYLFVDMPPGTGDVPLTVFQSLPVDGIVIVTTPQELVSMIVAKAAKMAEMMHIPVLGLLENMSYVVCPHCGERLSLFGESRAREAAQHLGIPLAGQLPLDPALAALCDRGEIERASTDAIAPALKKIVEKIG